MLELQLHGQSGVPCDKTLLIERLGSIIAECGLEPDSRTSNALLKVLVDDVMWFFDHCVEAGSETSDDS